MGFFNSPVQDAIEEATSEKLQEPDWARIMQICDMINTTHEAPKDAIKTIGKRLTHSNFKVNQHALTLLDACLKNCTMKFHKKFAKKDFQKTLKEIATSKKTLPIVRDRLLELIQVWSTEFRQHPESQIAVQTYEELRREGVTFPDTERGGPRAPIFTPPARQGVAPTVPPVYPGYPTGGAPAYPVQQPSGAPAAQYPTGYGGYPAPTGYPPSMPPGYPQPQSGYPAPQQSGYPQPQQSGYPQAQQSGYPQSQQPAYPASQGSGYPPQQQPYPAYPPQAQRPAPMSSYEQQRRKLIDDINVVRESINILAEALNAVNPVSENVARNEVMTEFSTSCKQMRPRVAQLIETINDEAILAELCIINDHLNRVIDAYDMACRRQPIPHQPAAPPPWSASQQQQEQQPQQPQGLVPALAQPQQLPPPPQQPYTAAPTYYGDQSATGPYAAAPVAATQYPSPATAAPYQAAPYSAVPVSTASLAAPAYSGYTMPPPQQPSAQPYAGTQGGWVPAQTTAVPTTAVATAEPVSTSGVLIDLSDSTPTATPAAPVEGLAALSLGTTAGAVAATSAASDEHRRRAPPAGGAAILEPPPSHLPPRRLPPILSAQTQPQAQPAPLLPSFTLDTQQQQQPAAEYSGSLYPTVGASQSTGGGAEYSGYTATTAAPIDDEFDAIARRRTGSQAQQPRDDVEDAFAAIAARHSVKPGMCSC